MQNVLLLRIKLCRVEVKVFKILKRNLLKLAKKYSVNLNEKIIRFS